MKIWKFVWSGYCPSEFVSSLTLSSSLFWPFTLWMHKQVYTLHSPICKMGNWFKTWMKAVQCFWGTWYQFQFRITSCEMGGCINLINQSNTLCLQGELHVVRKGYTAAQEDEISLKEGETIEVIHKLLDGWWVVR